MSEEQKIIDLENEISFLKDALCEKQKEIEKLNFENHMIKKWNEQLDQNCISKDKIREKIKELETLYNCNLDTAMTSYEMFVFVRSYIDKVKNVLKHLLEEK